MRDCVNLSGNDCAKRLESNGIESTERTETGHCARCMPLAKPEQRQCEYFFVIFTDMPAFANHPKDVHADIICMRGGRPSTCKLADTCPGYKTEGNTETGPNTT